VPSLYCSLISEETDGRLDVNAAWSAIANLRQPVFYLSGPPPMITALSAQLRAHGMPAHDIRIDAWD